jgi:putative Holliday junction resolvase
MPVVLPPELRAVIPTGKRLFGVDVGSKTLGLALSDIGWRIASPYKTLARKKFSVDAIELFRLITQENVGGLVVGLPVSMEGGKSSSTQSVQEFVKNIMKLQDMPVAFWDERLSTMAVSRMMIDEMDLSRKRQGLLVDKLAASYILQGCLDSLYQFH